MIDLDLHGRSLMYISSTNARRSDHQHLLVSASSLRFLESISTARITDMRHSCIFEACGIRIGHVPWVSASTFPALYLRSTLLQSWIQH